MNDNLRDLENMDQKQAAEIQESQESKVISAVINQARYDQFISELFADLGIPANIKGYGYIKTAIYLIVHTTSVKGKVTSKLYPEIAFMCEAQQAANVERGIRHAITVAWDRGNYDYLYKIFRNSISPNTGRPTNSQFMAKIVEIVKIECALRNIDLTHISST